MTLNEPNGHLVMDYLLREHTPGLKLASACGLQGAHSLLLAHVRAVQTIRARALKPPTAGVVQNGGVRVPASDAAEDVAAAQQAMFATSESVSFNHAWFGDPMILGRYPERILEHFGRGWPTIGPGDMETIHQPLGFLRHQRLFSGGVRGRRGQGRTGARAAGPEQPARLYHDGLAGVA